MMGDVAVYNNVPEQTEKVYSNTSTIGFRSLKCTPQEWMSYQNEKYFQATNDCEQTEEVNDSTKSIIRSTDARTRKLQADSTKRLKERLHDTLFWKQALEREINDVIQETSFLIKEKDRLQNFLLETDLPLQIATENLNTRECRRAIDKVADPVESELYVEVELIQNVQKLIKNAVEQAHKQICCVAFRLVIMDFKDNLAVYLLSQEVLHKISMLEHNLNELREAIRAEDDPLMNAQTRLHLRTFRPNMELCKDPASVSLVEEVNILGQSLDELLHQYSTVENKLKDLHDTQMTLEKEIELKTETIRLNQVGCIPKRTYYPSAVRLQGY
ncbi:tektin related [Schistosoma mansoni]|uniref:tektin related n=1 Tax=Schistosoma mansoni TaxID=6183 RepID=UPI0001A63EF6|nr:tektin related [Schistosoma mansoni]|eukprot:XP_018654711.1 tektin related [Schistosoma mansoni]